MSDLDHRYYTQHLRATLDSVDDSGPQQLLRLKGIEDGHTIDEVVRNQHFGLSSVPPQGAEGLIKTIGGRIDRTQAIGMEHPDHRPTGYNPGDTVLYDGNGNIASIVKANTRIAHSADIQVVVGGMLVRVRPGRVDLGAMDAPFQVVTTGGNSSKVYSVV